MKAILMSIKPQHVANILNELKTLEIRKRFPSDYVGWVYIYCTKGKNRLICDIDGHICIDNKHYAYGDEELNGKVVARFWCDKVEKIRSYLEPEQWYMTSDLGGSGLLQKSCLTFKELDNYLLSGEGCAIHITKLEIFDKPKEISEFNAQYGNKEHGYYLKPLTCAPQSWFYVEVDNEQANKD